MQIHLPPLHNIKHQTEYIAIDQLAPMPGAPRKHPKSQIRSVIKSLEAFGQVLPILVDGAGRIIHGHALWDAAKRLGMTEVMVLRIEHLLEERIKALMVALNRLGELSKWDEPVLNSILLELHGRPPFDPVLMFKILVLQALYSLSDEGTEFQIKDRLSFQRFLGLGARSAPSA